MRHQIWIEFPIILRFLVSTNKNRERKQITTCEFKNQFEWLCTISASWNAEFWVNYKSRNGGNHTIMVIVVTIRIHDRQTHSPWTILNRFRWSAFVATDVRSWKFTVSKASADLNWVTPQRRSKYNKQFECRWWWMNRWKLQLQNEGSVRCLILCWMAKLHVSMSDGWEVLLSMDINTLTFYSLPLPLFTLNSPWNSSKKGFSNSMNFSAEVGS